MKENKDRSVGETQAAYTARLRDVQYSFLDRIRSYLGGLILDAVDDNYVLSLRRNGTRFRIQWSSHASMYSVAVDGHSTYHRTSDEVINDVKDRSDDKVCSGDDGSGGEKSGSHH